MYRRFAALWDFGEATKLLNALKSDNPYEGYGPVRLFKCLLLQFMEDLSDRELERYLAENVSARWFCGFSLCAKTPDHTVFCRFRKRLGTHRLSKLFAELRDQLRAKGFMSDLFTFVDASQFWYGYKKHVSVGMQSGFIHKVALTKANVTDAQGFRHVCPESGAVYADKGYCVGPAVREAARKGVHLRAIKKNNMAGKNRDLDRWVSQLRAPFERVFSKDNKRVRYRGIMKNQFAALMGALCFNLKRWDVLSP